MLNLLFVLILAGGLALFALQNLTPIPLVLLGQTTLALPLAIWILIAIATGVATSLLIAGLYKASNTVASRQATARLRKRDSVFVGRFSDRPSEPPRNPPPAAPRAAPPPDDDWETDSRANDEWDDWDAYEEPRDRPQPSHTVREERYSAPVGDRYPAPDAERYAAPRVDRAGQRVANPDPPLYDADFRTLDEPTSDAVDDAPYEPSTYTYRPAEDAPYTSPPPQPEPSASVRPNFDDDDDDGPEEWEDWEGYEEPSSPRPEPAPYTGPTDFEVKQEPKTTYRAGTVYSYSYRDTTDDSGVGRTESVRRSADQPIITPPPASDQRLEDTSASSQEPLDDDDWGFDEFDEPKRLS